MNKEMRENSHSTPSSFTLEDLAHSIPKQFGVSTSCEISTCLHDLWQRHYEEHPKDLLIDHLAKPEYYHPEEHS